MHSTNRQRTILNSTNEGSWEWNLVSDRLILCPFCCELTGYTPEETIFDTRFLKTVIHPEDHQAVFNAVQHVPLTVNDASTLVCRIVPKNGGIRWIECTSSSVEFDEAGNPTKISGRLIDITERKQAENQLYKLNRSLMAISNCNQALLRANNEMELLNDICNTIVNIGGYQMAWVGYAENDDRKSVKPIAWSGLEDGYLETLRITWEDTERGRGPTGTTIRTGQPCTSRDMLTDPQFKPWRSEALKRGFASSLSLPLKNDQRVFGALMIYASSPDAFDAEESALLTSLADNMAYGITMLQNRMAKAAAENALRQSEAKYRSLFQNKYTVMLIMDPENGAIIDANPAAVTFYGWSLDQLCRMNIKAINTLTEEEVQAEMQLARKRRSNYFPFRHRLADGSIRDVEVVSGPITIDGKSLLYSIVNDVTARKNYQEMLVEGNNRMHYIMSATNAGIWETGEGSNVNIWSDRYGHSTDSNLSVANHRMRTG